MKNKEASILDYQKDKLCPQIWEMDGLLRKDIKKFIYDAIKGFFVTKDFNGYQDFISHIYIGSSLATYFYKEDSDLDIKIVIDTDKFKHYNHKYRDQSDSDIMDELIEAGRRSTFLTAYIPHTMHPVDVYFFAESEIDNKYLIKYDSLYNVITGEWIKEPKRIEGEMSPSYMLNYARSIADKYIKKISKDIDETKRDSIDFLLLRDYMKGMDKHDLKDMAIDYKNYLNKVNDDVESLIEDKQIVKSLRKTAFSKRILDDQLEMMMQSLNYSKGNVIFKLIQRYGYLRILVEISRLFDGKKINSDDVVDIYKILNND